LVEEFLEKYEFPEFPVHFRMGAEHTSPFGLQYLNGNRFRIHNATDRGYSPRAGYEVYCPFDLESTEWVDEGYEDSFGTILRGFVANADFEIRIMHMSWDELTPLTKMRLEQGEAIRAGDFLGLAGEEGLSYGRHTHFEMLALEDGRSRIWEKVLRDLYGTEFLQDMTEAEVRTWMISEGVDLEEMENYFNLRKWRGIEILNNHLCRRRDYHINRFTTFYNSKTCANGL